jgi:hypothetical protein
MGTSSVFAETKTEADEKEREIYKEKNNKKLKKRRKGWIQRAVKNMERSYSVRFDYRMGKFS